MITVELDHVRLQNPLNGNKGGAHWGRTARTKQQRGIAALAVRPKLHGHDVTGELVVTITRISSGTLDDDAVPASAKAIRDGIADALGTADNVARISWRYVQEKAKRGTWGVRIEIAARVAT